MTKEETLETVKLILARYLKENRMRSTPERTAILELFYDKGGLYTAEEVCETMASDFRVSRATVYNTVELLYSLGLLVRQIIGNHVMYEACFGDRFYFRTMCTRCGRTERIQPPNVSYAFHNIKYRRFHPEQIVTCVYGICSSCQSKATRARKKLEREEERRRQMRGERKDK